MKLNEDYFDDIEITDDDLSVDQTDENYQYSLIIQFKTQTGTREQRLFVPHTPFAMIYKNFINISDNMICFEKVKPVFKFIIENPKNNTPYTNEYTMEDSTNQMNEYITQLFDVNIERTNSFFKTISSEFQYILSFDIYSHSKTRDFIHDMTILSKWLRFVRTHMLSIDKYHDFNIISFKLMCKDKVEFEHVFNFNDICVYNEIPIELYSKLYEIVLGNTSKMKSATKNFRSNDNVVERIINQVFIKAYKDKLFSSINISKDFSYRYTVSVGILKVMDKRYNDAKTLAEYISEQIDRLLSHSDKLNILHYGKYDKREIIINVYYNQADENMISKCKEIERTSITYKLNNNAYNLCEIVFCIRIFENPIS